MAQKLTPNYDYARDTITKEASEALSKYLFVRTNATDSGKVDMCDVRGENTIGVLDQNYVVGDHARIISRGRVNLIAGEALSVGDLGMVGANGRVYQADSPAVAVCYVVSPATAAAEYVTVQLFAPFGVSHSTRIPRTFRVSFADGTTENTIAGFTFPAKCIVHRVWIDVITAEVSGTTKTLDVGTDGTGSNDPNGFLAGVSAAATGLVKGTLLNTGQTLGALLAVDESGAGVLVPEPDFSSGGESLTWTPASADWAEFVADIYVDYTEIVA